MSERRFPPPWSVEEQPASFVVRDHNGQALAYVYAGVCLCWRMSIMRKSLAGDQRLNRLPKTKRVGLRLMLPSCRSFCVSLEEGAVCAEQLARNNWRGTSPLSFAF